MSTEQRIPVQFYGIHSYGENIPVSYERGVWCSPDNDALERARGTCDRLVLVFSTMPGKRQGVVGMALVTGPASLPPIDWPYKAGKWDGKTCFPVQWLVYSFDRPIYMDFFVVDVERLAYKQGVETARKLLQMPRVAGAAELRKEMALWREPPKPAIAPRNSIFNFLIKRSTTSAPTRTTKSTRTAVPPE